MQAGGGSKVRREPELGRATEIGPQKGRGGGFFEVVPTWFHIVHDAGGSGNVTNKAVWHQLYVLNGTFAGFEHGGTNAGFSFTMAGITRTANTTWHDAGPESADERAMKQALRAGGDNTLNVYLTSGGGFLGWAYFPEITKTPDAFLDGVVIDWRSMLETSTAYQGQYDLGKTLPHEAGHWLNLYHTFQGGCSEPGDMVPDTPAQASPTAGARSVGTRALRRRGSIRSTTTWIPVRRVLLRVHAAPDPAHAGRVDQVARDLAATPRR